MAKKNKFSIIIGKDDKEDPNEYHYLSAVLDLTTRNKQPQVAIRLEIQQGFVISLHDMDRRGADKSLSIEEAEILISKLNEFVDTGKKFIDEYSENK